MSRSTSSTWWLPRALVICALFAVLVALAILTIYRGKFGGPLADEHQIWAQFGDYVGGTAGTVFAFFALVALILSLWVQHHELEQATEALKTSSEALTAQSRYLANQGFENRFFKMVSLHHEIVRSIDLRKEGGGIVTAVGRDCIRTFFNRLSADLEKVARGDVLSVKQGIVTVYESFYRDYGHELSHYFRNLYRILKFIDSSHIEDPREYSGILRAQLSDYELALILYNSLSPHGEKMKPLAEKYALFEHLAPGVLPGERLGCSLFDRQAFGTSSNYPQYDSVRHSS